MFPIIDSEINPYKENIQGRTNEPICVAALLDQSKRVLNDTKMKVDWTLDKIYHRLNDNAPRIAVIGGSIDHPAHLMDMETVSMAALRIWENGGVPFHFSTPVMCDGTAQSNQGMSYSLESRNAITQMVVSQMESHSYHGALVLQSCDKQPFAIVNALSHIDFIRQRRGEAPVFATFLPAHVLKGGTIPDEIKVSLNLLADKVEITGYTDIAEDLRDTMTYILQCSSNTSFQGVFERIKQKKLMTQAEQDEFEMHLSVEACDKDGGICAFNGTGNSSRHVISGLGLVHPDVELLTAPATRKHVNTVVDSMAPLMNDANFSVGSIVAQNIKNSIRIHSASGSSTNLIMHMIACMQYAGYKFDLFDLQKIHQEVSIPDLFDYSLTEGRDIFALASQCCSGQIRGMETLFYELIKNGIQIELDAPTVTGQSWRERLSNTENLSASNVKENPIILSKPRRRFSGVDVLKGNFFESAVVKISGMSTLSIDEFDKKISLILYYENEDLANKNLLNPDLLQQVKEERHFNFASLKEACRHNAPALYSETAEMDYNTLFDFMAEKNILKITIIISGQGPEAFGMPEMFTPMQHINTNKKLRQIATLISDGRYSGVTRGAALGHVTPEAINRGGILYLQSGDLLHINLKGKEINFVDKEKFEKGSLSFDFSSLPQLRYQLGEERIYNMKQRQKRVAATNRILYHTDASYGVIPLAVAEEATKDYELLYNS
ncbi:MAG: dihydroxy-acid dehydratase [Turicibacter sp.]|nr:dihydroxy-acid dehydratase [Turicibacter sp.]